MNHIENFLILASTTANLIHTPDIEDIIQDLIEVRDSGGRVFVLGAGGSAANASHMVNDLRKLCNIESYCPTDNTSELTARVNDEGWENFFVRWLEISRFNNKDALFILSVGGGDSSRGISVNLIRATDYAHAHDGRVMAIVGKQNGYVARYSDSCCVIPETDPNLITPMSEAFQGIVWHCIVSHPSLQIQKTTW
jgi:D-sedoheptulose 7-phosphate isomerase